jgi:peptidoglycan/xylan/chitin deacetylase (PgdA/CDA1 family)
MKKYISVVIFLLLFFNSCSLIFNTLHHDDDTDDDNIEYPSMVITDSEVDFVKSMLAKGKSAFDPYAPIAGTGKAHVLILMYHQISKNAPASSYQRSESQFLADMQYLKDQNIVVIGFDDLKKIQSGQILPPGERMAIISFDDGWLSQYDSAYPILKNFGYKASFSIVTSYVGKKENYMTWNQLKEMASYRRPSDNSHLFSIASHTVHHTRLDTYADWESVEDKDAALKKYLNLLKQELLKSATEIFLRIPESRSIESPLVLTLPEGAGSGRIEIGAMAILQGYHMIRTSNYREYTDIDIENIGYYGAFNAYSKWFCRYKLPSFAIHDFTSIEESLVKYFDTLDR